jgi:hypothetical protein
MNNYPQNHCFNPAFKYVPAEHTNIRDTFERIKQDQQRTIDIQLKPVKVLEQ